MIRLAAFALTATLAALSALCLPIAARAEGAPIVIGVLGRAPVLGQLRSTPELREKMHADSSVFLQAAALIGLTNVQIDTLMRDIDAGDLRYGLVPRHLERMTWAADGVAHVLNNVIIPAGTHGWEIDLRDGRTVSEVFIPAACGNLSIIHRRLPPPRRDAVPPPPRDAVPTPPPAPVMTPSPLPPVPPPPPQTIVRVQRESIVPWLVAGLAIFLAEHKTTNTTTTIINNIPSTPPPCWP
ncbi:MAG: hypothetical protein ACYDGM_12105 [Vulcanimicrobiaceae bacterium]